MKNNKAADILKDCFTETLSDIDKDILIDRLDNNTPFYKLPLCQNDLRTIADKFKDKTGSDIFIYYGQTLKDCIKINIQLYNNTK